MDGLVGSFPVSCPQTQAADAIFWLQACSIVVSGQLGKGSSSPRTQGRNSDLSDVFPGVALIKIPKFREHWVKQK